MQSCGHLTTVLVEFYRSTHATHSHRYDCTAPWYLVPGTMFVTNVVLCTNIFPCIAVFSYLPYPLTNHQYCDSVLYTLRIIVYNYTVRVLV